MRPPLPLNIVMKERKVSIHVESHNRHRDPASSELRSICLTATGLCRRMPSSTLSGGVGVLLRRGVR